MTPTPIVPEQNTREGDFATISAALDYAALQKTGLNFHSLRGELTEVLTYAALREQAVALAGRLLALGLRPGDRVALAAESDGDFLRAFFACQYAGLAPTPLPLPAPLGGKEAYVAHVRRMMISAGVRAAFAPAALAEWFAVAAQDLGLLAAGSLADIKIDGVETLPAQDPDGLCYLQFSSGSTRFPLGVEVTQNALMANVRATGGKQGLGVCSTDRTVTWLPLYHDMGLVGMLLTTLAFQVSIDMLPTGAFVRRPGLWLDLISSRRGSVTYAPTFGYDLAARRAGAVLQNGLDLSSWRVAGLGGDMIRPGPLRAFAEVYGPAGFNPGAFVASYGMAETTLAISLTPVGDGLTTDTVDVDRLERQNEAMAPQSGDARIREFSLCGRPLVGHALEVRNPGGAVLADRQVGRIFAKGPSLMRAYFGAPDETAQVLSDGWLDTGDLGYSLRGQIVITGRAKDLIIVNGRNVWPQDLEWSAEREISLLRNGDVAVFSHMGDQVERVVALVQCRSRDDEIREALRRDVTNLLRSRHGLDVEVILTPPHSLPQTSSGKLSRSRSKALFLSGAFSDAVAAEMAQA